MALAEELGNRAFWDQELYRMTCSEAQFSLTKAGGRLDLSPRNKVLALQVDIQLGQW